MKFLKVGDQLINLTMVCRINLNAQREAPRPSDEEPGNNPGSLTFIQDVIFELVNYRGLGYPEIVRFTGERAILLRHYFENLCGNDSSEEFTDLDKWSNSEKLMPAA